MFSKTWNSDGPNYGDPAMSLIIPEPQYASDYTWSSVKDPTGAEFYNKVSVIIDKDKVSGLLLDDEPVTWEENVVSYSAVSTPPVSYTHLTLPTNIAV